MIYNAVLEINLKNVIHNYHSIKKNLGKSTKIIPVIKANGYGAESFHILETLAELGVETFAVAYFQEALTLREKGFKKTIIVLYPQEQNLKEIIEYGFEPVIYNKYLWQKFQNIALSNEPLSIHIEVNTGMNRMGFSPKETLSLLEEIKDKEARFKIKTLFSHLSTSEDITDREKALKQITLFEQVKKKSENLFPDTKYHILNTSGVFNFPEYTFDWVRCGIGLHGYANHPKWDALLKPVASLKTKIIQITSINEGDSVGYGNTFIAKKTMNIATLAIGYADGIPRDYGMKGGEVYLGNQSAPIIGNICMDATMLDVTNISCVIGDEVCFFDETHPATLMGKKLGTIPYEIILRATERVKRVFIK